MRLALYQAVPGPRDVPGNLARLGARLAEAAAAGADLLLTPEMFLTGYDIGPDDARALAEPVDGAMFRSVAALAVQHGVAVLYGYPERLGENVFNAVQLVGSDGVSVLNYRKTHLFGELDRSMFTAADQVSPVVGLDRWKVAALICYDVEFPENVRELALADADVVLVPTANMVPYDFVASTVVPTRAYENQVFLAYANYVGAEGDLTYCGLSCVISPDGAELARGGREEQLLIADLDAAAQERSREETPYLTDRRPELYPDLSAERDRDTSA